MRVLVQNLCTPWLGALPDKKARLKKFLALVDSYDLLLLQELFTFWIPFGYSLGDHREWFSTQLYEKGFRYIFLPPPVVFGQDCGLVVASRMPVLNFRHIHFKSWWGTEAWTWKGAMSFKIANTTFINTHLQSGDEDARLRQLDEVNDFCNTYPTVIAGDLNMDAFNQRENNKLQKRLPMFVDVQPKNLSMCSRYNDQRLERVLVLGSVPMECSMVDLEMSDHPGITIFLNK